MKRRYTTVERQAQADRYLATKVRELGVNSKRIEMLKMVRTRLRDEGRDSSLHAARLWCQIRGIET
jgi:hypothetical protein